MLRIRDPAVAVDFDTAVSTRLLIADIARAEREAEAIRGKGHRQPPPVGPTVEIIVDGARRRVPTPPAGFTYDREGNLVDLRPANKRGH